MPTRTSPDQPPCAGTGGHEWKVLPYVAGQDTRAVARCCGITATVIGGVWRVDQAKP